MKSFLHFCIRERLLVLTFCVLAIGAGVISLRRVPLDAIPNVGENQVIVLTEWTGRSPKDIEDQITYPLSIALQAVPGSKSVRGKSMFGFSFVQITFDDNVDVYWARSRVSEQLGTIAAQLPSGATPTLGPDATALGQVYYYVLDAPSKFDLAELRSKQDYFVKYALQSVEGVAEVASIGGYVKQYQIDVDPDRLRYFRLTLDSVVSAVSASNLDVGAKTVEENGMEFIVRGRGFIGSGKSDAETIEQIKSTVVQVQDGVPITVAEIAEIQTGPAFRRGALDYNGREAVGGVVVMRYGENPREVIKKVKEKISALEAELDGIKIIGVYDRTQLIDETIFTLSKALAEETVVTIVVVLLFLLHLRASLIIAITLPMAVLMSFIAMKLFGVDANIMSLAGIAIAIGTMVDMGIIVLENIYDALADWESEGAPPQRKRIDVVRDAALEVIPAVMTAVTTTIVSFLPVFMLTGRDERLFTPLAWTKTFALASSLIVAVVVVPMLCHLLLRTRSASTRRQSGVEMALGAVAGSAVAFFLFGIVWRDALVTELAVTDTTIRIGSIVLGLLAGAWLSRERLRPVEANPVSRLVRWVYGGRLKFALERKTLALSFPLIIFLVGLGAWFGFPALLKPVERIASAVGADLNSVPGYVDAKHLFTGLESDDWIALDEGSWFYMPSLYPAASFGQAMEVLQTQDTLIKQIPEVSHVLGKIGRVESALDPAPVAMVETYVMLKPRHQWRAGITERDIWDEVNRVATVTGVTPASPLQPIEGRVVMLQSGIKASMAIRIYGDDLQGLAAASRAVADQLKRLPVVNSRTVNPDIVLGKPYVELEVDRERSARFGMTTTTVNQIVSAGLGGIDVTETVEGRERYPIQVRFARASRERIDRLPEIPVVTATGEIVALGQLTDLKTTWGPGAINSEDARLVAHVSFSPSGALGDLETVNQVMASLRKSRMDGQLEFPPGNFEMEPVGSFQNQIEANRRLLWIVPTVVLINLLLHYLHFRELALSLVVFSGIPFAAAGGMIAVATMGVQMNTAMWIGFIALFGIAADDGLVIATYMKQRLHGKAIRNVAELRHLIHEAGLKRVRPCLMTTVTTLVALLPVLTSTGRGADVAQAMALPVFGGMLVEPLTSFVVPTLYCAYRELRMNLGLDQPSDP